MFPGLSDNCNGYRTVSGKYYKIIVPTTTFNLARAECQGDGGDIAHFKTELDYWVMSNVKRKSNHIYTKQDVVLQHSREIALS